MRDLIFVSLEDWDDVWRRNQFLCAELAGRFPQQRILFVGRPLFLPVLLRNLRSKAGRQAQAQALRNREWNVPQHPNITVFNPIKPFPNPIPGGRPFNETYACVQIRNAARRAGLRQPLLWINPFDSGFLIGHLNERGVVYDITDDWELAAPTGVRERIAAQDRELCQKADLTVVCSQALYNSRRSTTQRLLLLPNGVDSQHYRQMDALDTRSPGEFDAQGVYSPRTEKGSLSPEVPIDEESPAEGVPSRESTFCPDWPRPVFGYTGTLHRERIDLDLVLQLARAHPKGSVVLIGPHHWTDDSLQLALQSQPNLHAPGSVPYQMIPEVMAHFDVCIVPHRCSEFTESLNPIKLWEYLACGKPIVSTDVAGFRDFPQFVRVAHNARDFIGACREALTEINQQTISQTKGLDEQDQACFALRDARRSEALKHSWRARVDVLLDNWRTIGLLDEKSWGESQMSPRAAGSAGEVAPGEPNS